MSNEQEKVIYSMHRVTKRHGQKEVLKDITLGYFYGAKIGVLGLNGAGKSSLLKILAGVDKNFEGDIVIAPGYSIGYLEQEPLVDETRTVREVVEEGVKEVIDLVHEFNDINAKFAEPMEADEMDALIERQAKVQEKMDAVNAWDIDSRLEMAMDALRCPPSDTPVSVISGGEKRRVALCRLLLQNPDVLLLDINMPELNGIEVLDILVKKKAYPKILMLTVHSEMEYLIKSIDMGADGYLLKDADSHELIRAIYYVYQGEKFIQPSLIPLLNSRLISLDMDREKVNALSDREIEVLRLVSVGFLNKDIAKKLYISERTVKNHLFNIFKKINCNDRTQAAVFCIRNGLVRLDH